MTYNPLAQSDDPISDSDFSELRASPGLPQRQIISTTMLPDDDLHSSPPEAWSRPRTASRDGSGPMECPTPDLQSVQGAYRNNVDRLERSAERLSLSSDIGEAIRQIREEQKQSDSRRSSILNSHAEGLNDRTSLHRQLSYGYGSHASNSIVETNSIARSGGFSPTGYFASPRGSVRSSRRNSFRGRSASQEPRLERVTEPQQEGKPLDSPMSTRFASIHAEPSLEGKPLDSPMSTRIASIKEVSENSHGGLRIVNEETYNLNDVLIPRTDSPEQQEVDERQLMMGDDDQEPRPSTDTARQVNGLFSDFDGVHTITQPPKPPTDVSATRRRSTQMLDERPQTFAEPDLHQGMVYYPAPVPMMLNLPKKLSKQAPSAVRDKRRTQMMGNLPSDTRKSAALLPRTPEMSDEQRRSTDDDRSSIEHKRRTMANLPPQLRATMFFDYPGVNQEVEVKGGSAVATLDSILDASAFAPVSAFTDHPIVGQAGANIYSRPPPQRNSTMPDEFRKRDSSSDLLTKKSSRGTLLDDTKKRNSLMSIGNYFGKRKSSGPQLDDTLAGNDHSPGPVNGEETGSSAEHDEDGVNDFVEPQDFEDDARTEDPETQLYGDQPTTLLAELQMRKQQQKTRTRTAATTFPDGMHSTLLQLDAVAHVQQKARNEKRTLLAWEDPDAQQAGEGEDNEDVPLGMLYPTQKIRREDEDRPLGLIAQRHMEDNEPLSFRRARLRGEDPRKASFLQRDTMQSQEFPDLRNGNIPDSDGEDEHPGETLAQRLRRIKATQIPSQPSRLSGDFASEIMSQLGGLGPAEKQRPEPQKPQNNVHSTEPEETLGQRRRRLQAEAAPKSRNVSGDTAQEAPLSLPKRRSMADILQAHPAAGAGVRSISNEVKYVPAPRSRNTSWAMQVNQQAGLANGKMHARGGGPVPHPMTAGGKDLDDTVRKDMIDRWRQSVMH